MTEIANRKYKDRLFHFIFGRPENRRWTLSLYNAVNHSNYSDENLLEFNTIREIMYMGMHNDVSFLILDELNLYEQQSTFCPNMPLRQMQYVSNLFERFLMERELNKYGKTQIKLPVPKLISFYIGQEEKPDEIILSLMDSFPKGTVSDIYVRVKMLNINIGHNRVLLEGCPVLKEYSWLIMKIRTLSGTKEHDLKKAIDMAINYMPESWELKSFLAINRMEVKKMLLTEYNEAETMRLFRKEGKEEGRKEGRKEERERLLCSLVSEGAISEELAASKLNMTVEAFRGLYTEAVKTP